MKNFIAKFIDIMIGVVLGLGFQWWPDLRSPWQYVAFLFFYVDIIDYWIDYGPSLRKFPPKREYDVVIDVAIAFAIFLCIFSTKLTVSNFLISYGVFTVLDLIFQLRIRKEYPSIQGNDKSFVATWIYIDAIIIAICGALIALSYSGALTPLIIISVFIAIKIVLRIYASTQYKKIYFS